VEIVAAAETAAPGTMLRVLMIDDSDFVLGVHAHLLKKGGFDVQTTTSPLEFEHLLEQWKPHLVLMDVRMAAMSGDGLCRNVKARFKAALPIVFLSDLPHDELAERAKKAGADAYLPKSSDWAGFLEFVRNICAMTYSPEHLP
jgi:CheY-like chemotaxis protein